MYQMPTLEGIDLSSSDQIPLSWVLISAPIGIALLLTYHKVTEPIQQLPDDLKAVATAPTP
jgi:hypothetical protein